jgi:hypothetical protein
VKLWDVPLTELPDAWDEIDKKGTYLPGIRALCLEDRFYLLVKACRRYDALHPWIYARCRQVERDPDDALDLWAREHYKSTLITYAGIIQEILRDPEITCCIFSHTKGIARKFFRQIRYEFETNTVLQSAFPDILWADPAKQAPRWSEETGLVVKRKSNPKESTLEAWGLVDGQPTSAHYKLRVYDDVVAPESVTTPEQVARTTASWELSDNLGAVGGRKWHVGTRYSFADTYQAILERGALKARLHPATDDGRATGNPVMFTPELWAEKKIIQGPAVIACQMLQNPIAGQMAMFDVSDLQQWEIRPHTLNVYILCDPARSTKKGSANTAFAVIGVDAGRNKYLLDGFNHRMDLKRRWESMKALRRRWLNEPGIQMVKMGYEGYGAQSDMDYFKERMEIELDAFPIEELMWPRNLIEASKDDRVQRLGPDFRQRKFYVPSLIMQHGHVSMWKLSEGTAGGLELTYSPSKTTSLQQRVINEGQPFRVCRPINRIDSDGNHYDVTRQWIEQVMLYPFAPLKDLVDAGSRVYDMDPRPPVIVDEKDVLPEVYADGI